MMQLKQVHLVQFFLFEKVTFDLTEVSGIFGPNGSGKSTIIDAIQIALFGANGNDLKFNAQADDRSSKRTLKSYCLGQHGSEESDRVRDAATTYISLVWRNDQTGETWTTGVCIAAEAGREKHDVLGRYVVPGVAVTLADHLDVSDGNERPLSWGAFRAKLLHASNMSADSIFLPGPQRYLETLLVALRGTDRAGISPKAFVRALRFSLSMKYDENLDTIIRHHILEDRPVNVERFRRVTESFRRLKDLIAKAQKKLEDAKVVQRSYSLALDAGRKHVSWQAISENVHRDALIEQQDAEQTALETVTDRHNEIKNEREAVRLAIEHIEAEMAKHNKLKFQLTSEGGGQHLREQLSEATKAQAALNQRIEELFGTISSTLMVLGASTKEPSDTEAVRALQARFNALRASHPDIDADTLSSFVADCAALGKRLYEALSLSKQEAQREINELNELIERSREAIARSAGGKAPLPRDAQRLQAALEDEGIDCTSICDVTRIEDPLWQPVIESYLGISAFALMIDQKNEKHAYRVYRRLKSKGMRRVKLAVRERQVIHEALPGSVAELIVGDDPHAVAYLRNRFGRTMRAESERDAFNHERSLTVDGMFFNVHEIDSYTPRHVTELYIGPVTEDRAADLSRTLIEAQRQYDAAQSALQNSDVAMRKANTVSEGMALESLTDLLAQHLAARDKTRTLHAAVDELDSTRLEEVEEAIKEMEAQRIEKHAQASQLDRESGGVDTKINMHTEQVAKLTRQIEASQARYSEAVQRIGYDDDYAQKAWDSLMETAESTAQRQEYCDQRIDYFDKELGRLSLKAHGDMVSFLNEHQIEVEPEVREENANAHEWLTARIHDLESTEIISYQNEAQEAYLASQESFKNDVAVALYQNVDEMRRQIKDLNKTLERSPDFSNGERYKFKYEIRRCHKSLYDFIQDAVRTEGGLLGEAGEVPEEFQALMDDTVVSNTTNSPLVDYREFFDFDIEISQADPLTNEIKPKGFLSKRISVGSGGEHKAPLYMIAGAALSSAYHLDSYQRSGIRLMPLDEAFNKMDAENILAVMNYLENLGFQVLLASPGEHQVDLTAFMDSYFEIIRDPIGHTIDVEAYHVDDSVREKMRKDLMLVSPKMAASAPWTRAPEAPVQENGMLELA